MSTAFVNLQIIPVVGPIIGPYLGPKVHSAVWGGLSAAAMKGSQGEIWCGMLYGGLGGFIAEAAAASIA